VLSTLRIDDVSAGLLNTGDAKYSQPTFSPQKSKPRNGAGEIFVTAVAEISRETVSAANSLTRPPRKTTPIRDKIDSLL
jgi:hypothetical protein